MNATYSTGNYWRYGRNIMAGALVAVAVVILGASQAQTAGAHYQAKNLFAIDNPADPVAGAATLIRTTEGISYSVSTSGLEPGASTVWVVIFNKPENCAEGPGSCAPSDLSNPTVQGSVVAGSGHVVSADGIANFVGSLDEGTPPTGIQVNVPLGTVDGLKDSLKAEVHLVVRQHGAVNDTGEAVTQLTTYEDECTTCADVQAAIFEAVR
jgi:hypothetical protein